MQTGIAELHLRLDTLEPYDRKVLGPIDGGVQERRFSHSGFTPENHGAAHSCASLLKESAKLRCLLAPPDQHPSPPGCCATSSSGITTSPQLLKRLVSTSARVWGRYHRCLQSALGGRDAYRPSVSRSTPERSRREFTPSFWNTLRR